jgi:frataxin-like iron-binding protein CyaY
LEYDLDSESREPKKQTIMPLPTDLSHFIILSTNPYHSGMFNPFGIAVVGADHCLRTYSFEHGFPALKLPPALEFLGPNVINGCHIPQFPEIAFKKLAAITAMDRKTKYFPITGGVAGPDHVYHVDSNDLLLTIHQGEVVKFWDASYTALRPLSHLTIHCLDDVENPDALLCCLDVNKENGALSIGFSDGSIIVYECQAEKIEEPRGDPKIMSRNEEFINSCDDTLKEISDLLEDMGHESDSEHPNVEADDKNPFVTAQSPQPPQPSLEPTNPFVTPSPNHQQALPQRPQPEVLVEQHRPETPVQPKKSKYFKRLDKFKEAPGFYAALKISLDSPIQSIVSIGESM